MMGVVWVVSYPRSGGTWVRLFLAHLLRDAEVLSLDLLEDAPSYADRRWVTRWSSADRPTAAAAYAASVERPQVPMLRVQEAFASELFQPEITERMVLVVRDPRDVAVSLADHYEMTYEQSVAMMNDSTARIMGVDEYDQHLGTWSSHVDGWMRSPLPRAMVRFEDLLDQPAVCFETLAWAIAPWVTRAAIMRALVLTQFDLIQQLFFRADHDVVLSSHLRDRVEHDHQTMMRYVKYL